MGKTIKEANLYIFRSVFVYLLKPSIISTHCDPFKKWFNHISMVYPERVYPNP